MSEKDEKDQNDEKRQLQKSLLSSNSMILAAGSIFVNRHIFLQLCDLQKFESSDKSADLSQNGFLQLSQKDQNASAHCSDKPRSSMILHYQKNSRIPYNRDSNF